MMRLQQGALLLVGVLTAGSLQAAAVPDAAVRTSGRMVAAPGGGWLATWPGTAWSLRFKGSGLGVRLKDSLNYWVLEIDGKPAMQIGPSPGEHVVMLDNLSSGEHQAQLIKRSENPQQAGQVLGFVIPDVRNVLPAPPAPRLRIEFIGDSYTAAMGNISPGRACAGAEISARTDVTQGFAILTARALQADWRIHAKSGMGLVRNWNGGTPNETHGTHYARQLQSDPDSRVIEDGWVPDIVVIGLGTNDLSTPVRADEPRNAEELARDVRQAYRALLADVHRRDGEPAIVLLSTGLGNGDQLRPLVAQMLAEERAAGHRRVASLDWGPLTAQGCGSHPDASDHRRLAERLTQLLQDLQ